jgi:hypothetical protein
MGVTTTNQLAYDGLRNTVWRFTGLGDGQGDESLALKVDITQLVPLDVNKPITSVKVKSIQYSVSYGIVQLYWDGAVPVQFAQLEGYGTISFAMINGLQNNAGPQRTGNILFSTVGFELNSTYDITLEMIKRSMSLEVGSMLGNVYAVPGPN